MISAFDQLQKTSAPVSSLAFFHSIQVTFLPTSSYIQWRSCDRGSNLEKKSHQKETWKIAPWYQVDPSPHESHTSSGTKKNVGTPKKTQYEIPALQMILGVLYGSRMNGWGPTSWEFLGISLSWCAPNWTRNNQMAKLDHLRLASNTIGSQSERYPPEKLILESSLFLVWNTSFNGPFSIAMLLYWSIDGRSYMTLIYQPLAVA